MNNAPARGTVAASPPSVPVRRGTTYRMAGLSALAFAASVVSANSLLFGAPMPGVPLAEAAPWYEANGTRAMLATAMVGIAFPALLVFAASMFELARGADRARPWMLVGGLGAAGMVGVFTLVTAGQIGSVLLVSAGEEAFAAAWTLHNAAFAINMTVLGTAFLGFAIGAHAAGLNPGWMRSLGVTGALLMLATGLLNGPVTGGSLLALVGFGGFLLWLFWLVTTGVRLLAASARVERPAGEAAGAAG